MKGLQRLKNASPAILTCLSVAGVIGTAVLAVKATPKAMQLVEERTGYNGEGVMERPTKKEAVQLTWKCYIPAGLVGLSTIACIVGINAISKRNQASLMSAYAMLSQAYQRYRKAAKTVYGEDADANIKAQAAKETFVSADGYSLYSPELDGSSEKMLFYDDYSQRYFTATMAAVLNAQYHLNRNLTLRGDASINEFYEFMGVDKIAGGDEVGWDMGYLTEGGIMWLDFDNRLTQLEDGLECCVISALWDPVPEYYSKS